MPYKKQEGWQMAKIYKTKSGQEVYLCTQDEKIKFATLLLEIESTIEAFRSKGGLPNGWNAEDDNALQISRWVLPYEFGGRDNDIVKHQLTTINKMLKKLDVDPIQITSRGTASSWEVKRHMDKQRERLAEWEDAQQQREQENSLFEFV